MQKRAENRGFCRFPPNRPPGGRLERSPGKSLDVIVNEREWRKEHRPGLWLLVSAAVIYAASLFLYRYEMQFTLTDLAVHAGIAAGF